MADVEDRAAQEEGELQGLRGQQAIQGHLVLLEQLVYLDPKESQAHREHKGYQEAWDLLEMLVFQVQEAILEQEGGWDYKGIKDDEENGVGEE